MKKAILVTEENKNLNRKYLKNHALGSLIVYSAQGFPRVWKTPLWVKEYFNKREAFHEEAGFFPVVEPKDLDLNTGYLSPMYFNEVDKVFTYDVVLYTQDELNAINQENQENEAREAVIEYREKGVNIIEQTRAVLYRRYVLYPNGQNGITYQQLAKWERWFKEVYDYLLHGNFRQADNEIEKIINARGPDKGDNSLGEATGMLDAAITLQTRVNDYFKSNKYKM